MPLSERQRDPRYKSRNRKKYGSIYGFTPRAGSASRTASPSVLGAALASAPPPVPNIDQILANNPFYQGIAANVRAESVADAASRDAAMRRAIIDFGYIPEGAGGALDPSTFAAVANVADPTTRELARKNTEAGMSVWARLQDAAKQTQKRVIDSLGARGMFNSGETGYGLQRATLQADQQRSDATQQALDYLSGLQSAFTLAERQRLAQLTQAQQGAVQDDDGSGFAPTYGGVGGSDYFGSSGYDYSGVTPPPFGAGKTPLSPPAPKPPTRPTKNPKRGSAGWRPM